MNIGESGKITDLNNNEWKTGTFKSNYADTPLVFSTTQSTGGTQDPSSAHLRNLDTEGFETQHCELDLVDVCDNHNWEDNGWAAIKTDKLNSIHGIEGGKKDITGSGNYSIKFDNMNQTPLVFTQSQTSNSSPTRNTRAFDIDSKGAKIVFCSQNRTDSCADGSEETIAWMAIDPSLVQETSGFEYGRIQIKDSNWDTINFDQSFEDPVVMVDVQTQNGSEEALYPEADNISPTGAQVRYCEAEGNNDCDSHPEETIAWLALDIGPLGITLRE